MNPVEVAKSIIEHLGGKENVLSGTHCATRLRLVLNDEEKVNKEALENLEEVKGVFSSGGQFQIILGTGSVNKVYQEFVKEVGLKEENNHNEMVKRKMNPFARLAKTLSNIFVPIIPAIVASGLLMGLLGMMKAFKWVEDDSALLLFLDMFSSSAFIILPILIGFSAAKEFGSNPFVGAVIGGILTHPALLNPWTLANAKPKEIDFLGMNVDLIGYQGTVIPILLAIYAMSKIEKGLRKIVPNSLDLLVTPFVTIIVTGFVSILAIGPLGTMLGEGITTGLNYIYTHAGFLAGLLFGGLYSTIVITGVHHSFHAVEASLLADPKIGVNFLLPIWSMANVAQGGAGLAVYFMTKNKKMKTIAGPGSLSAFLGITEPIIFGVNLRYVRPFIGGAIGGALGAAYVVFMKVAANAYGLTGIPMTAIVAPLGTSNLVHYLIGFVIAVVGAFVTTLLLGIKEKQEN